MPSITVSGSIDPLLSVVLNKGESILPSETPWYPWMPPSL